MKLFKFLTLLVVFFFPFTLAALNVEFPPVPGQPARPSSAEPAPATIPEETTQSGPATPTDTAAPPVPGSSTTSPSTTSNTSTTSKIQKIDEQIRQSTSIFYRVQSGESAEIETATVHEQSQKTDNYVRPLRTAGKTVKKTHTSRRPARTTSTGAGKAYSPVPSYQQGSELADDQGTTEKSINQETSHQEMKKADTGRGVVLNKKRVKSKDVVKEKTNRPEPERNFKGGLEHKSQLSGLIARIVIILLGLAGLYILVNRVFGKKD
jgi:hypothetical protein